MCASSVTVFAGGRAGNVRLCVPKWRFRASAIRHGFAARPTDNSPRPSAESDLDTMNRCTVFQDASRDGASIDVVMSKNPIKSGSVVGYGLRFPDQERGRPSPSTLIGWAPCFLRRIRCGSSWSPLRVG
jgi:hypothetical protein